MSETATVSSTLYDRIGGEPAVKAAVEVFYRRILADEELAPFFQNIEIERLKRHQFAFFSQVMDGPKQYGGATMEKAHSRLSIQQKHFDSVAGHLIDTLRELKVEQGIVDEVVSRVAPLSTQVVNTPS